MKQQDRSKGKVIDMKKWIVFLTALLLVAALAVPALAANTEVAIAASGNTVCAGDKITVTISISTDGPYTSLIVDELIDERVFEFVDREFADAPWGGINDFSDNTFAAVFEDKNAYSGLLLTLSFKVKEGAPLGKTTIGGNDVVVKNGDETIAVTVKSAEVTVTCRHSFNWVKTDENTHTGTCSSCGESKSEAHDWADEVTDVTPATCDKPGSETLHCLLCDATKTVKVDPKGHAYDNDCDTDCNNGCGTTRKTSHKLADDWEWVSDEKSHWVCCTVCGEKVDEVAHIPDRPAATEKDPQKCLECGYVMQVPAGHVHDFDTIWQQDEKYHWHVCKKPGCYTHGSSAPHDYDSECDVSCNTCGHVRKDVSHVYGTEWKGNASGHWYVCIICGGQSEVIPHIPGDPATMDTPQTCTECGYWIKFPLSHKHTFGDKWQNDETNHWKACVECGEYEELIPHNWDEGTVITAPTDTMQGSMLYRCKDCSFVRTVAIPMLGPQPTDPTDPTESTEQVDPTDSTDDPGPMQTLPPDKQPVDDGEFPWWILVAIAGVLLLTGIVLFVVEFIRSRKHNMHGRFSK